MPKIIVQLEENCFKLLITPEEADALMEICVVKEASVVEALEAIFVIGSIKMVESLSNPTSLT